MTKQERKRFNELCIARQKGISFSPIEEDEFADLLLEYQKNSLHLSTIALIVSTIAQFVVLSIAIISKIMN